MVGDKQGSTCMMNLSGAMLLKYWYHTQGRIQGLKLGVAQMDCKI